VGEFCDRAVAEGEENPNYSYIQWDRLAAMSREGVWDVQSHSYAMHRLSGPRRGVLRRAGESDRKYAESLRGDFAKIKQKLTEVTGREPVAFAYPFGCLDDVAEAALREQGIKVSFCSHSGKARILAGDGESLSCVRRLLRTSAKSARSLIEGA